MTRDVQDAIEIMTRLHCELRETNDLRTFEHWKALVTLANAIGHLAYPDRDVYPKTRRSTKGGPIVRH